MDSTPSAVLIGWPAEADKSIIESRRCAKPLYYAQDENGIVFASEIKALLTVIL